MLKVPLHFGYQGQGKGWQAKTVSSPRYELHHKISIVIDLCSFISLGLQVKELK